LWRIDFISYFNRLTPPRPEGAWRGGGVRGSERERESRAKGREKDDMGERVIEKERGREGGEKGDGKGRECGFEIERGDEIRRWLQPYREDKNAIENLYAPDLRNIDSGQKRKKVNFWSVWKFFNIDLIRAKAINNVSLPR
jgi:hypothetical protein